MNSGRPADVTPVQAWCEPTGCPGPAGVRKVSLSLEATLVGARG